jgi:4-hydroxy-tetrahydrodipicolinate reductase
VIRVCLSGARGRMGCLLAELLREQPDLALVSAIERMGHPDLGCALSDEVRLTDHVKTAVGAADVVLDFSLPEAVLSHLELAANLGKPMVTGTTGFSKEQEAQLKKHSKKIPVVWSANMSRGVHVLRNLVRQAASALAGYDLEILEIHHRGKVDAPSGTARLLAEDAASARGKKEVQLRLSGAREVGQIGMAALRGGDVVGEHQVMFLGFGEQIVLTHRATSREHFCRGALDAIRFISGRSPGFYTMKDVFEKE